eukprot:2549000-Rhodomonas_salina.1
MEWRGLVFDFGGAPDLKPSLTAVPASARGGTVRVASGFQVNLCKELPQSNAPGPSSTPGGDSHCDPAPHLLARDHDPPSLRR